MVHANVIRDHYVKRERPQPAGRGTCRRRRRWNGSPTCPYGDCPVIERRSVPGKAARRHPLLPPAPAPHQHPRQRVVAQRATVPLSLSPSDSTVVSAASITARTSTSRPAQCRLRQRRGDRCHQPDDGFTAAADFLNAANGGRADPPQVETPATGNIRQGESA